MAGNKSSAKKKKLKAAPYPIQCCSLNFLRGTALIATDNAKGEMGGYLMLDHMVINYLLLW